jgi:hypothetical protein
MSTYMQILKQHMVHHSLTHSYMHESHPTGVGDLVGALVVGAGVGACKVQSGARATCMYITTATHVRQNMKAASQRDKGST